MEMAGWYRHKSSESIPTGDDMKVSDRALSRLKARVEGLPAPEEIRRIRRKLGLTQEAAGELVGDGPRAFQKYEAGGLLPSRAIGSTLALLDHDPKAITVLKARRDKMPLPDPVRWTRRAPRAKSPPWPARHT